MKYANSKNLTIFDVVTIASMIEREAGVPKQRKLVASVITTAARRMTLGSTRTIRFAPAITKAADPVRMESESPYNTRTHAGCRRADQQPRPRRAERRRAPGQTGLLFYVNNPTRATNSLSPRPKKNSWPTPPSTKRRRSKRGNQPTTCR